MNDKARPFRHLFCSAPLFFFLFFLTSNLCKATDLPGTHPTAPGTQHSFYMDYLLKTAEEKKLHENRYWHILLHYEKGLFGTRSLVDDPDFFLSPEGKRDPKAELDACITVFFQPPSAEGDLDVCRFIARYAWLKDELGVDLSKVKQLICDEVTGLNPTGSTLIFPTYFMNNPASMFGHTLINIKMNHSNKLLSKSVNYSARTDETNGLFFAVKGLTGSYEGYYSVQPYYMKIQQYSDMSQRDIWEYELNLTHTELKRMVRHIRELEEVYADYYFFDENCSYNLLYLLEAARPEVRLSDKFSIWAIPIDTVREVKRAGMIDSVSFRASKSSKIKHKASLLTSANKKIALDITKGDREASSVLEMDMGKEEKTVTLDLAAEYIGYLYINGDISKKEYQKTYLSTLKARSKLGQRETPYHPPAPAQPDKSHASRRFDAGAGINLGEPFVEVGFRPAFSDLLDTDYGYHQGLQIKFFDTRIRYYVSDRRFVLNRLDVVNIASISPMDAFFKPYSWKVLVGAEQKIMRDGTESPVMQLATGVGAAYHHRWLGLFYGFLEPFAQYGPDLEKKYALGGGVSAGTIVELASWWRCHLWARQIYYLLGDTHISGNATLSQNFKVTKSNQIRVDVSRERAFDNLNTEAGIYWSHFF